MDSEVRSYILAVAHRLKFLLPVITTESICGILGAAIVLFITLFKTTQHVWQANSLRLATTLGEVLLRDGASRYLVGGQSNEAMRSGSLFFL